MINAVSVADSSSLIDLVTRWIAVAVGAPVALLVGAPAPPPQRLPATGSLASRWFVLG